MLPTPATALFTAAASRRIGVAALHVEAVDRGVVAASPDQHAYLAPVVEQAAHEIRAQVAGRPGHQHAAVAVVAAHLHWRRARLALRRRRTGRERDHARGGSGGRHRRGGIETPATERRLEGASPRYAPLE